MQEASITRCNPYLSHTTMQDRHKSCSCTSRTSKSQLHHCFIAAFFFITFIAAFFCFIAAFFFITFIAFRTGMMGKQIWHPGVSQSNLCERNQRRTWSCEGPMLEILVDSGGIVLE